MTEEEEAELDEYIDQKWESYMREKIPGLLGDIIAADPKIRFESNPEPEAGKYLITPDYTSPYGTPVLPIPEYKPFSNSWVEIKHSPEVGFSREYRSKPLPATGTPPVSFVRARIEEAFMLRQYTLQKSDRYSFFISFFEGFDDATTSRVEHWLQQNTAEVMTNQVSPKGEVVLLQRFIDLCISICCKVVGLAEALSQLKEMRQDRDEPLSDYLIRAKHLARLAKRPLFSSSGFTEEQQSTVLETINYVIKGMLNRGIQEDVRRRLPGFIDLVQPNEKHFDNLFRSAVFVKRAAVETLPPAEKTANLLVGLSWHQSDRNLMEDLCTDFALMARDESMPLHPDEAGRVEHHVYQPPSGLKYFCGRCKGLGHSTHYCVATKDIEGTPIPGTPEEWLRNYGEFLDGQDRSRKAAGLPVRKAKLPKRRGSEGKRDGDRFGGGQGATTGPQLHQSGRGGPRSGGSQQTTAALDYQQDGPDQHFQ